MYDIFWLNLNKFTSNGYVKRQKYISGRKTVAKKMAKENDKGILDEYHILMKLWSIKMMWSVIQRG